MRRLSYEDGLNAIASLLYEDSTDPDISVDTIRASLQKVSKIRGISWLLAGKFHDRLFQFGFREGDIILTDPNALLCALIDTDKATAEIIECVRVGISNVCLTQAMIRDFVLYGRLPIIGVAEISIRDFFQGSSDEEKS